MTEQAKRERGVKVVVKRGITLEDGTAAKVGEVIVISSELYKHFVKHDAVSKDIPDEDE